jgi:hypothetical protein
VSGDPTLRTRVVQAHTFKVCFRNLSDYVDSPPPPLQKKRHRRNNLKHELQAVALCPSHADKGLQFSRPQRSSGYRACYWTQGLWIQTQQRTVDS